jgi:subtilisin-like proprotein convertase family protein
MTGTIADVNLAFDISHTYVSDLTLTLIAPDGTRIQLLSGIGGSNDNFTNTVLDDQAATSIENSSAPYTGTFNPEDNLLAGLNGLNPNGTWTLEIQDAYNLDGGALNNWSLTITTA